MFKFGPEIDYYKDDNNMEIIMNNFLDKRYPCDLFTLQSRIYSKLLSFAYGIKNNKNSPSELKEQIVQNTPTTSTNESISAKQLRQRITFEIDQRKKNVIHKTKYELFTFGYFSLNS